VHINVKGIYYLLVVRVEMTKIQLLCVLRGASGNPMVAETISQAYATTKTRGFTLDIELPKTQ